MKKFLLISGLAVAAMVSCTKNEVYVSENNDAQISFNAPVVQLNTKAVAGEQPKADGKYSTAESFNVYASWTKEDYAAGNWGTSLYMDNVKVSHDTGLNGWAPADAYYWPKTGVLTFAAYSPSDVEGTVAYGAKGLTVTGFTVKDTPAEQYDFMYAERSYNRKSSTNESEAGHGHTAQSYSGVDLVFHHALSSIVFKVKANKDITNTKFTVKKVEILNAQNKGDFAEKITDGTAYVSAPEWSNTTGKVDYVAWAGSQDLAVGNGTDETSYVGLTNVTDIILLPQAFANTANGNVKVKITYSITRTAEGSPEIDGQVAEFDLSNNYEGTEAGVKKAISEWEMGKRYTYNILFDLEKIYFAPEVTNWVDVNMDPISVK